jgi:hypothetical protein
MHTFENIRVCGIGSKNTIESKFVIALSLLVEVAHLLLPAFIEELIVVLLRVEDEHLTVDDFNDVPEIRSDFISKVLGSIILQL